ncbi:SlyX family protein [Reinekea sp. G2M2-21]|uniref:SlyX family protein n=1 Tax=Reinekea sp. G2M2-21 TaxID=2788942 RepID=UPI0018AA618A|nr:SlyX family protein [Reinekea sp. G2M2-21]MDX1475699.1 SlyX family protein [Reinekea sp.]
MNIEDQLIDLEIRLTHMDDTVEQLNQVVTAQQKTIDRLEHLIIKMAREHSEMKEQLAPDIVDSRPPHY